ncbi:acyl-CoA dehydrogenase family protein [Spirillospora sp. NBC_00431]
MSAVEQMINEVRRLAPLLESEAPAAEAAGQVTGRAIDALREAGVLGMLAPQECGGLDLGPVDALRVFAELSRADGSAAWVVAASTITAKILHLLDAGTVKRFYADGIPIMAGQIAPFGTAVPVPGGYRISGQWSYGSGILHADYVCTAAMVDDGGDRDGDGDVGPDGAPRMIEFIVPIEVVKLGGNWDVLGLKGTGSVDYALDDVFVPDEHIMENFKTAEPKWGGRSALIGLTGWFTFAHTGWALGVGRRALDEIAAHAKRPSGRGTRLADDGSFKEGYAIAEAKLRSAQAWAYDVWGDIERSVEAGRQPTTRQHTLARTASVHLHDVDVEVAAFAFQQGGGAALRSGALQRAFRDVMAGGQHIQVSHQKYHDCARDLLGEAEGLVWRVHELG